MGHFVELMLELLFGLAKGSPEKMPEIGYLDRFVIRHPFKKTMARVCACLCVIAVFSVLWVLIKQETRYLFVMFALLGVILLFLSLFAGSFRCEVNEAQLSRTFFWIFKKQLKWQDVLCVRVVEQTNEKTVIIALYDRTGKCVMDFHTDMENVWYIVKMAERKAICIRHEKDLSVKQLDRL